MMGERRLRPYRRSKRQLNAQRSAEAPPKEALEIPVTVVADPAVSEEARAHAAATSMRNAVDLLAERLRRNLENSDELRRTRRRRQRRPRTVAVTRTVEPADEPSS